MKRNSLEKPSVPKSSLSNWDDVNFSLLRFHNLEDDITLIQLQRNKEVHDLIDRYDEVLKPLISQKEATQKDIEAYVRSNLSEFQLSRSKVLPHGTISIRQSKSISVMDKAYCLKKLVECGLEHFIIIKEEPNKTMLASLDDVMLRKLYCERIITDNISIQ